MSILSSMVDESDDVIQLSATFIVIVGEYEDANSVVCSVVGCVLDL